MAWNVASEFAAVNAEPAVRDFPVMRVHVWPVAKLTAQASNAGMTAVAVPVEPVPRARVVHWMSSARQTSMRVVCVSALHIALENNAVTMAVEAFAEAALSDRNATPLENVWAPATARILA